MNGISWIYEHIDIGNTGLDYFAGLWRYTNFMDIKYCQKRSEPKKQFETPSTIISQPELMKFGKCSNLR